MELPAGIVDAAATLSPKSSPTSPTLRPEAWDSTNWDLNTQQPHGGQEWSTLGNFVEDFSVTTNVLGPPWRAVAAAAAALEHLDQYPPSNFEPMMTHLAEFLQPDDPASVHDRLMLGNGASELIDLVTRIGAHPGNFCVPYSAQYKEYERAALAHGRKKIEDPKKRSFGILAIVNPCNPNGEYKPVDELKAYIENICPPGTTVLVDESMQPWVGKHWREDSLISQHAWIRSLALERDTNIYVIHSWTKIWSCPGIRLGSVLAPTRECVEMLKPHQVPWSMNIAALAFLDAAVMDQEYLEHTWSITTAWRERTVQKLAELDATWVVHGKAFLSWLWVDVGSETVALRLVAQAKRSGVPIRHGGMGYGMPNYVRIAVRAPDKQDVLFAALRG